MKKLLPIILLFMGLGAGVGAGVALRPAAVVETEEGKVEDHINEQSPEDEHTAKADDHSGDESHEDEKHDDHGEEGGGNEYAKLNNQFVVPIVTGEEVVALVVLALSIEVPNGKIDIVYKREPKLRDSILQVLFDHANVGGFEGNFTDAQILGRLREALNEVAQRDLGQEVALDVLIEEIARQDY